MTHDRRLIEDYLPLEGISYQSAREKFIRHGHISTLHIWWARRPLAAMRAAIFAALLKVPEDERDRIQLRRLIAGTYNAHTNQWEGGICDWDSVKEGNDVTIKQAREHIKKQFQDTLPSILDPFMGGGSTGLEALRLGCETYGVELNPVAHIIELCTLLYPQKYGKPIARDVYETRPGTLAPIEVKKQSQEDENDDENEAVQGNLFNDAEMVNPLAEDVKRWAYHVLEEAYKEIGFLYEDPVHVNEFVNAKQGGLKEEKSVVKRTVVAYLWARTTRCPNPNCRSEMPLIGQYWLARKTGKKVALKPVVDIKKKEVSFEIVSGNQIQFDPSDGTIARSSATCLVCGQSAPAEYIKEQGRNGSIGKRLLAVIYKADNVRGKQYRTPTEEDHDNFEQARSLVKKDFYPTEQIPDNDPRNIWIYQYGFDKWGDLFDERQILALNTFKQKIEGAHSIISESVDEEYGRCIATYLALMLDRLANQLNSLARWHNSGEKIEGVFSRQSISMVWDYIEVNPFSGSSGDWVSAMDWILRVISHASETSEYPANLIRGDARRLSYPDGTIDAVITDPPYYDAISYANLSDFFYVWMKRVLGSLYPEIFATPLTPKSAEIIQDPARHGGAQEAKIFYETQMTKAFTEAQRVLKQNGIMVVVFAHKSTTAWETLINSLLESGLVVTASWPLNTEMGSRIGAQGNASLASSIYIVCRKRLAEQDGIFDEVRDQIQQRIGERLNFFWREGIRGADFFISAIGPAVEVFGQYRVVRKLSGEEVTVAELLDLVQQEVANYALSQVLNGSAERSPLDPATRYYIMYRWSYGTNKVEFDDGMRLAQALGAEIDEMLNAGILNKSGSNVNLQGPYSRNNKDKLGEPGRDHQLAPLVDLLHRAALLWQDRQREELAEFMRDHVAERTEAMRTLAQAIINIMPDGDKERQLYEGFLQTDLPTAPRQGKLW